MTRTAVTTSYAGLDAARTAATRWVDGDSYLSLDTNQLWVRVAGAWEFIGDATGLLTEGDLVALLQDSTTIEWTYAAGPHTLTADVPADTFAPFVHVHAALSLPDGSNTGDFLRWDGDSWAVAAEPLNLTQINLTPALTAALNAEGGMFYKSTDKSVYVCTSAA